MEDLSRVILADRPVIYLPLDDPTGSTTARDLSGNGLTGTKTNGSFDANGHFGQVFNNSSTGYITCTDPVNCTTAVTEEVWVYLTSNPASQALYIADAGHHYLWAGGSGAVGGFDFRTGNGARTSTASSVHPLNEWFHVACTVDINRSPQGVYYVNGRQVGTTAIAGSGNYTDVTAGPSLYIAGEAGSRQNSGLFAHAAVYNQYLTQEQIRKHYEAGTGGRRNPRRRL